MRKGKNTADDMTHYIVQLSGGWMETVEEGSVKYWLEVVTQSVPGEGGDQYNFLPG